MSSPSHVLLRRLQTNDSPLDATTALFIVAFFVTSYRCFSRYKKKLWWHDDSVALFSTLCFVLFLIGSYIYFRFAAFNPWADGFSSDLR